MHTFTVCLFCNWPRFIQEIIKAIVPFVPRITSARTEPSPPDETQNTPITLSEAVDREQQARESQPPEYSGVFATPSITITDETDSRSNRPRSSTSRNSLSLTRNYLRRSFVRKSDSVKSIRSSLRRNFKYGGALTSSHEQLVRGAEPMSNTVAMSAMLDSEGSPHARSLASVIWSSKHVSAVTT